MQTFGSTPSFSITQSSAANPTDLTNRMQIVFSKKMLPHVMHLLVMQQFAQKVDDLINNAGSLTMRFFKRRPAASSNMVALTEGTPNSTYAEVSIGKVDITLKQVGEKCKVSDVRQMTDIFDMLQQNIEAMGEDAALAAEETCRDAVVAGLLASDGLYEKFAGVSDRTQAGAVETSANRYATLKGLTAANAKITRARALGCVTRLKRAKVPTINGTYACVVPPELLHDIRQDETWLKAAQHSDPKALYNREIITLDGVRYVEGTATSIEGATYGTQSDTGDIFSALFLGRGAFGAPKLSKSNDPWAPKVIILNQPDKSDPQNQYAVVATKMMWNAGLLLTDETGDVPHLVQLRCKTTFEG